MHDVFSIFIYLGKTSIKVLLRKQKNAMTKEQRRHQALQVYFSKYFTDFFFLNLI